MKQGLRNFPDQLNNVILLSEIKSESMILSSERVRPSSRYFPAIMTRCSCGGMPSLSAILLFAFSYSSNLTIHYGTLQKAERGQVLIQPSWLASDLRINDYMAWDVRRKPHQLEPYL